MRRFILALKLMEIDRLDINSGFVTAPYFQDDMNPQFRYCDACRIKWKKESRQYKYKEPAYNLGCRFTDIVDPDSPGWLINDLGKWNNACPEAFYWAAEQFNVPMEHVEKLMNARWLPAKEHLEMLARITFTADLKWLFSIYAAQRFWDAAMVGCVNLLPERTVDQDYFPEIIHGRDYVTFNEDMSDLNLDSIITEAGYNVVSRNALALYNQWMRPSEYAISTNLLRKIFQDIEAIQ